ncbi:MAG: hypothetical protein LBN20_03800, partial [Endomicrobium sp.]|nr:hypothetical protein [Endomicrobium sp.]
MPSKELMNTLSSIKTSVFESNAHTTQHRLFGFITTNIRSIRTIAKYIEELFPKYIKRKENLEDWENWATNPKILKKHKQKFLRLEIARILFRKIKDTPELNNIGEKLYRISRDYNENHLIFILTLYLLSGRYFDTDNQPLVEIEKIVSAYKNNIIDDSLEVLLDNKINSLLLGVVLYNPASDEAMELAYKIFQNEVSKEDTDYLISLMDDPKSYLYKKIKNAGGIGNFKKDIAVILNYVLFKQSCQKFSEQAKYDDIINEYVEQFFETKLNEYLSINNKEKVNTLLLDSKHRIILKDIF